MERTSIGWKRSATSNIGADAIGARQLRLRLRSRSKRRKFEMGPRLLFCALALTLATAGAAAVELPPRKDVQMVAPALDRYTEDRLHAEVWMRPGLSRRDRSLVTLAALIGRNQTIALSNHLKLALAHGVKPAEISEIVTHLAFYSGWANAMSAIAIVKDVFAERNIGPDQLAASLPALLPLKEAAEADRAKRVGDQFGSIFPGVTQYTTDILFRDLWLRPDLAPRDRSLVTISALVANGQVAQLTGHIPLGMNNGLTQPEIAEAITHLAFYVGWPNVFSAMPVAKEVFEKHAR
jgi:4-carboxymuconolactone decarboxylase